MKKEPTSGAPVASEETLLPEWVSWLAQDADGAWWGYEVEPLEHERGWYENEVGRRLRVGERAANPNWRQSLKRVR